MSTLILLALFAAEPVDAAANQGSTELEKALVNLELAVKEARDLARKDVEAEDRELQEAEAAARKVQADTAAADPPQY